MQYMNCNACQRVVQINNTGICLGCQRGFTGMDAEDVYKPRGKDADDAQVERAIDALETRKKEIEAELKKSDEAPIKKVKRGKK